MLQPLPQKAVELQFFIGLVHLRVGIAIAPLKMTLTLKVGHFRHVRVVVKMHRHPRRIDETVQHAGLGNPRNRGVRRLLEHLEPQRTEACVFARQRHFLDVTRLHIHDETAQPQIIAAALRLKRLEIGDVSGLSHGVLLAHDGLQSARVSGAAAGDRRRLAATAALPTLASGLGSQCGALACQPVKANQRHGIVQLSRHQSIPCLGKRHDVNQNVFVFVFDTVYAAEPRAVDQATEQRDLLGAGARTRIVAMELDQFTDIAASLFLRLAARDIRRCLAGLHQSGDRLQLPRRDRIVQGTGTDLLDQHDMVMNRIVE